MDYDSFLRSKRTDPVAAGFEVEDAEVNPKLWPWQREIVRWAVRQGRAAIFADCGLGKSFMQLEFARIVCERTGTDALILAPLSVGPQTRGEAVKLGWDVTLCRSQSDVRTGVNVTNYEMLKHFDPSRFGCVVIEESGILKAYSGQRKKAIIASFRDTPFRLACTATPSPNDTMELGNHAEFLGVPGHKEMLARFFINDTMEAGNYRLKGHAEAHFWRWVASWAVSLSKPSDIGYPDDGYILPPLNVVTEVVDVDVTDGSDGMLFRMPDLSATGLHKEMRRTAEARAERVRDLAYSRPGKWLVWCHTDYEQDAVEAAFRDSPSILGRNPGSIRGKTTERKREQELNEWMNGDSAVLIAKPSQFGFGMNFQHCSNVAFVGVSYSFESFYQAVRRSWRFGQRNPVNVHVVMAETEGAILRTVEAKQAEHETMKSAMVRAMVGSWLRSVSGRGLSPVTKDHAGGDTWEVFMGDNCREIGNVVSESVGLTVSSLPFEGLYIYSDIEADMGNCRDGREFFDHMGYLIPELLRVTIPGRLCVMHCKDLPLYRGRDGAAGLRDFPGEIVRAFEAGGWTFHSRVTIWKDPVTEMQRTKNHGLLYKVLCQDSSASRQGMADYLLVFRRPTDTLKSPVPVCNGTNPERFDRYVGLEAPDPTEIALQCNAFAPIPDARGRFPTTNPFPDGSEAFRLWSIMVWQKYASPVWFDIDQMDVLQYREARDEKDERHICPLQLDVIERAIHLWSNPGDVVLDPFNGIGSTGVVATKTGRRYVGLELKPSYFRQAVRNLKACEADRSRPTLFDSPAA